MGPTAMPCYAMLGAGRAEGLSGQEPRRIAPVPSPEGWGREGEGDGQSVFAAGRGPEGVGVEVWEGGRW